VKCTAADRCSVPVDAAALCLNDFVVFAKSLRACPRCDSTAWISLSFYVPRRGLGAAAGATPP
jgi:hypothetical protein